jgi:hypothetical protein
MAKFLVLLVRRYFPSSLQAVAMHYMPAKSPSPLQQILKQISLWSKANLFVSIPLSFKWLNVTCLCLPVCTSDKTYLSTRICNIFLPISETSSVLPWLPHRTIHESYDGARTHTFSPKSSGSQFWAQQLWGSLRCTQVLFQASLSPCLCRPWNKTTSKLVEQTTSSGGHNWWTGGPWFTEGMHKMWMGH